MSDISDEKFPLCTAGISAAQEHDLSGLDHWLIVTMGYSCKVYAARRLCGIRAVPFRPRRSLTPRLVNCVGVYDTITGETCPGTCATHLDYSLVMLMAYSKIQKEGIRKSKLLRYYIIRP